MIKLTLPSSNLSIAYILLMFFCFGISGCIVPVPMGPGGMMSGAHMPGTGGIMGVDAEQFSRKLVTLKIGSTTKEQAIAVLGNPAMKADNILMYTLKNTGSREGTAQASLVFVNGVLHRKDVQKIKFENGSVSSENVYQKGKGL